MEKLQQFWHSLTKKSRLLVIGLVAGICIFLYSGFSSAGFYWYDGEAFTAGSFFLPDKYQYSFFEEEDMNTAYNWMYGDDHEELQFLNGELAKLRYKKLGGLILGILLVGGAGYQLRREENFKKALATLV